MKNSVLSSLVALMFTSATYAQMQVDKQIDLTGGTGERKITNLEMPVAGTDAANKDYVDNQIATVAGGGGSSKPSMMSTESASSYTIKDAIQYCENLTEATFSDWRLPTLEELTYFAGDGSATSNYLWTKSQANGKENPVNQNYAVIRLSDGKWRNAGEVTGLLLARTATGDLTTAPGTFTSVATLTPLTPGNVIVPTHVKFTGAYVSGTGASSCTGNYRLKMNFADGSSSYSSVFSGCANPSTFVDMQSIPLLTSVTPLNNMEIEILNTGTGTYGLRGTLVVSGYEVSMTQKDSNTLKARCVR